MFVDYNQNAKDRTVASAYSVRPKPGARVSAPLSWDEVPGCDPADFTITTMPERFREVGDHEGIDEEAGSLDGLHQELSARKRPEGLGDARGRPITEAARRTTARTARRSGGCKFPLIEIGRAQHKADALAGLERWEGRHPDAAEHLEAGGCAGRFDAGAVHEEPGRGPPQSAARARRDAPGAGGARPGIRSVGGDGRGVSRCVIPDDALGTHARRRLRRFSAD